MNYLLTYLRYASAAYAEAETLCFALSVPFVFRPVTNIFLSFRENAVTTTNRLNDCILDEIGTGAWEQDVRENSNRR